jgi:hypothetical protein
MRVWVWVWVRVSRVEVVRVWVEDRVSRDGY